jgi:hypothetical protein
MITVNFATITTLIGVVTALVALLGAAATWGSIRRGILDLEVGFKKLSEDMSRLVTIIAKFEHSESVVNKLAGDVAVLRGEISSLKEEFAEMRGVHRGTGKFRPIT